MEERELLDRFIDVAAKVRREVPLVHSITNCVTVNDVANATLAVGGTPAMADNPEDVRDFVAIASCTNINMGKLDDQTIEAMVRAGKACNELGVALMVDPLAGGVSAYRNSAIDRMLSETSPTVIRGNLSEMAYVAGRSVSTRGVDVSEADAAAHDPVDIAVTVAREHGCISAVTGAVDVVSDGKTVVKVANGVPEMGRITGSGCMLDGVIGAFIGVADIGDPLDVLVATTGAICSMGLAGELALARLEKRNGRVGTGSFHIALIDELSLLDEDAYRAGAHLEVLQAD